MHGARVVSAALEFPAVCAALNTITLHPRISIAAVQLLNQRW